MKFNEVFTIERKQRASDGQGGFVESYAEIASERGRMVMGSAHELKVGEQLQARAMPALNVRGGADIQRGDRVTGSRSGVFLVIDVRRPSKGDHLECDCRQYEEGA